VPKTNIFQQKCLFWFILNAKAESIGHYPTDKAEGDQYT